MGVKMKTRAVVLLLVLVSFKCNEAKSKEKCNGKWEIPGLNRGEINLDPIEDTLGAKEIIRINTTNVTDIDIEDKYSKYLEVKYEPDQIVISTTDDFKNFDYNEVGRDASPIYAKTYFYCGKGYEKVYIYQPVIDINSHPPTFTKESYEYNFRLGIPKDSILTDFEAISTYDYDFTNDKVYYSIEDEIAKEYFSIREVSSRSKNEKNYTTTLTVLKNIMGPLDMEFDIMAKDVGEPPLTSTARVKVSIKDACSTSVFKKVLYTAEYDDDSHELKMEEEILLDSNDDMIIKQSGYEEYFKVGKDSSSKDKIIVQKLKDLPKEVRKGNKFIRIDIHAKKENSDPLGSTALLIHFTQSDSEGNDKEIEPPTFDDYVYFAKYSSKGINLNKTIIIKYDKSAKLVLKSIGYEEFFQITISENQISFEMLKPLTNDILQNNFIVVYVEAKSEGVDDVGQTAVLIQLQEDGKDEDQIHPPVFDQHVYFANYSSNQLHLDKPVKVLWATANMIIRLNDYDYYFSVSQNPNIIEEIDISVKKPLPEKTLQSDFIILEVEAENVGLTISARTALLVRLNQSPKDKTAHECSYYVWGFSGGDYVLPLFLFAGGIILIACINVIVIYLCVKKQKMVTFSTA